MDLLGDDVKLRYLELEELVGQELDCIFDVALRLSRVRARTAQDLRVKAELLQELIAGQDAATIGDVLVRSLCRDLMDEFDCKANTGEPNPDPQLLHGRT